MSGRTGLNSRQTRALQAILASPSLAEAARRSGIGEATIRRWMRQDAEFQESVAEARRAALSGVLTGLQTGMADAAQALREIATSTSARDADRIAASRTLLQLGIQAVGEVETTERLDSIEQALRRQTGRTGRGKAA